MKKIIQNKKIVMLLASDFSFDSRVLKEATSAARAGMKVTLLARKSFDTKYFESRDGFNVKRFQTWIDWFWARFSKNQGREVAGSQSAGTNIPSFIVTYTSMINLWFLNRLFVKECLKIKPNIVHANDSITLPAAYKLKKAGFKVVFDSHELYSQSVARPNWLWQKYYIFLERSISRLDGVFSVCQSILDELQTRYHTEEMPQAILYNAPRYQKFSVRKVSRPLKLLYLGNLQGTRDFSKLFSAIKKTRGVLLTNIGPGWEEGRQGNIATKPAVPASQVIPTAADYDVGIIPYIPDNLNNRYSTPNKLFEYTMAGLAIAASDLVEIKKVISEPPSGVLFDPESPKSIKAALEQLASHPKKIQEFKQNSLSKAKEYCWENQEKKQLDLYAKIIAS